MGFFSGFKKIISAPISLVEDIYTGTKTVVTDVYGGIESAFSTAGDATKKVVGTTWDATEEVAETIGGEGVVLGVATASLGLGAGAGLLAGTYLKTQKEQRSETLGQQRSLAGLGLSGQEIGYLQATTPAVDPFQLLISPGEGLSYSQPVTYGPGLAIPQYELSPDTTTETGFNITGLIPYAALGIGAFLLWGAFKK